MEYLLILGVIIGLGYLIKNQDQSTSKKRETIPDDSESMKKTQINIKQADIKDIILSEEQKRIFDSLESTHSNYYITGKAGTGKSILLQYFVKNTRKKVAVVAPTGVAALNVGGQTIHSFFKIKPDLIEKGDVDRVDFKTKEILTHIDAIVIDEISMVRVDLMEAISDKLKLARKNELPFGGVQLIMFGDLFQLPPVVNDGQLRRYFDHNYGGIYFFNAPSIKESEVKKLELNHIFRQSDEEFKELLNAVRNGDHSAAILTKINERVVEKMPDGGFITLAGHNNTVSTINHEKLDKLATKKKTYIASITGDLKESAFPTEKYLKLKIGAQVMMLKNDKLYPGRWVNGTLGIIKHLEEDVIKVEIEGVEHSVTKETWNSIRYSYNAQERKLDKEVVSSFTQFPVRLAWAITIHKSQGQTYQSVAIDLSEGAFAHGQTYVALSRCQNFDGLYLTGPIRTEDIIVDPDVIEFMSKDR